MSWISQYFNRGDEQFVSFNRDSVKRQEYLSRLQQFRIYYLLSAFLFLIIAIVGIFIDYTPPYAILILIASGLAYLESDLKIKMIKLNQTGQSQPEVIP